ncbi:hypothetical protein AWC38_SpisGene13410 [Stylophora pistillata]|uniref:SWIM-type domain-containing protein n=1 Tax=Stylophora pistillata TaxID=50429 RepID=A0A2B4RZ37_STYPI|nr:hypothetical protein AWC38_SpisGene13410 [Stylophora pistillata]
MANTLMCSIEEKLEREKKLPYFYRRYVDDTLAVVQDILTASTFLATLNEAHPALNFTMEVAINGKLPFIGMELMKMGSQVRTCFYRKTTDKGLLFHYQSHVDNRGAKTTGELAKLRRRVKDYIKSGLYKKYLRDPDGGLNLLRRKAQVGALSETQPNDDDIKAFPKDGYSVDLVKTPNISFGTLWKFMTESVSSKKQITTAKPLVKGCNFFMSKHVLFMFHVSKEGKHFIKSQVLPSMKKSSVYSCYICVSSFGYVLRAKCACPAGIDGRCNHVTTRLFSLESFPKTKDSVPKETDAASCTAKPCSWSVPPKRKGPVQPISAMKFNKHNYFKRKRLRQPIYRITASKAYRLAVMKSTTSPTKALKERLYSQDKPTKYMTEGLATEQEILELYQHKQAECGHEGLQVSECGFVISLTDGSLGAGPDRMVRDPSVEDPQGLLEMKYIQTEKYDSLEDALLQKRICIKDSEGIHINKCHQ